MARLSFIAAALALGLAAMPAQAGGKKEGAGESGGSSVAPLGADLAGRRELVVPPEMVSASLGNVEVNATMLAGAGAGKCRMNFVIYNASSVTIAAGFVGTTANAKGEIADNWVVNVGQLPPRAQTARLFSCALGAVKFKMVPTSEFSWPPVKCANDKGETEACPLGMRVNSTLPIADRNEVIETANDKDNKKDSGSSGHH